MCACDRIEAKSSETGAICYSIPHHCPLSPLLPGLPGSCSDLLLWCKRAPPLQNNRLAHPLTQKASVLSRVHYSIGQPCSSESTHAPLPEHRNNADSYSYPTAAYLAQCISCTCLLKVFKNVQVAFFACSIAWGDFSHHLSVLFKWAVTQCVLPALSSSTYRSFPCGCASFYEEFSSWLCILMSSHHGIDLGHEFAICHC